MSNDTQNYRDHLKSRLMQEIRKLAKHADVLVHSLYDTSRPEAGPIIFDQYDADQLENVDDIPINLDFDGIGVWYICYRDGDTFSVRHILVKREAGRFVHQQTGNFEGFWEDWPRYVAEDKWVHSLLVRGG
ncbi:MAG: hypothetical protein R3261_09740 [Alphaproteobacteria bacterium]|nr:hypothetical protein [Alphaproteobacteria bacterium]